MVSGGGEIEAAAVDLAGRLGPVGVERHRPAIAKSESKEKQTLTRRNSKVERGIV